jgi:dUTP pyrophosphatase
MQLLIQKLDPRATIPSYAHPGDAGLDLSSCETVEIAPGSTAMVRTGVAIALPPGTEGQVRPRSGLAARHAVTVLNAPGTIDEGYRGEVRVILINHGLEIFRVEPGMRIAQLVVAPVLRVETVSVDSLDNATARGTGGFGSTGA